MPGMHFPKFEKSAALSHHCGVCSKPLTNASAINTCIGEHEVICKNYHFTFHFVGKSHQCKACNHANALLQNRHRAIADLILQYKTLYPPNPATTPNENGGMITLPLLFDDATTPAKKLKKREKKDLKRIERAANRAKVVTHADIAELGRMMYPDGVGGEGNADSALSEALSIKFKPSVFSEVRLMEKLMIPSSTPPDYTEEVDRVLVELGMQKSIIGDKEESKLWEAIKAGLREDLEITWNASLQMKRRRIIYAQWVSQGAVDAMAQWAEDWDIGTGWKIEGGFKVTTTARKEDLDERDESVGTAAEESSEGEDVDVDDTATVASSLSALSIRKNSTRDSGFDTPSPLAINTAVQIVKDDRRGGTPLVERIVQSPFNPSNDRTSHFETATPTPFRPTFVGADATPWKHGPAPPVLRIIPSTRLIHSVSMMKENVFPKIPVSKAWNVVVAGNSQKRKAEALAANPPPPRVLKIATPIEQEVDDDNWISVGKKGKAK